MGQMDLATWQGYAVQMGADLSDDPYIWLLFRSCVVLQFGWVCKGIQEPPWLQAETDERMMTLLLGT